MGHATHEFGTATETQLQGLRLNDYQLTVIQQPVTGKAVEGNGKETQRKPIDPPPVVRLRTSLSVDPEQNITQNPYYFTTCSVRGLGTSALTGMTVSSMHCMKLSNEHGAFFVFGDVYTQVYGTFELQFDLYEMQGEDCAHLAQVFSNKFTSYNRKTYPGMLQSTSLTLSLIDQGFKLRPRRAPQLALRTQAPAAGDYNLQNRRPITQVRKSLSPEAVQLRKGSQAQVRRNPTDTSSQTFIQPRRSLSQGYGEPLIKRPRTGSESRFPVYEQSNLSLGITQYSSRIIHADPQGSSFNTHISSHSPQSYEFLLQHDLQWGQYTSPAGVTPVDSSAYSNQVRLHAFLSRTQGTRPSSQEQYYQNPFLMIQSQTPPYDYNQNTRKPCISSYGASSIGNAWTISPCLAQQLCSPGESSGYSPYAATFLAP